VRALAGMAILVGGSFTEIVLVPFVLFGIVAGIVALVLARRARIELNEHPELGGRKLALAGTVIGVLLIIPAGVFVFGAISASWGTRR